MRRDPCLDHLRGPLLIVATIRGTCSSINWIVTLLSVIMLGTGATISLDDFLEVVQRPFDVTFGLAGWFFDHAASRSFADKSHPDAPESCR